jgi:peptidoglycan/LPS O-acetylase OafA/YrhL
MKSTNLAYEPKLDHLRFLAATIVFLFHVYHFYYLHWTPNPTNAWMGLIVEGHTGLGLFFSLSGFIFMLIAMESDKIDYRGFIFNRVLRIAPLFLFIFFISISIGRDEFKGYFILYTLFSNLGEAPTSNSFVTGAAWTISVEFTFYLLFPFIARFLKEYGAMYLVRMFLLLALVKVACFLASERSTHLFYSTLVGRLDQFFIGMFTAYTYWLHKDKLKKFGLAIFLGGVALVFVNSYLQTKYFSYFLPEPNQKLWISWSFQESIGWSLLIAGYLLSSFSIPRTINQFMVKTGEISYSFYLLHGMVIYTTYHILGPIKIFNIEQANAVVNAVILFCLSWCIAYLSYHSIEKPFLAMRKKYVKT